MKPHIIPWGRWGPRGMTGPIPGLASLVIKKALLTAPCHYSFHFQSRSIVSQQLDHGHLYWNEVIIIFFAGI